MLIKVSEALEGVFFNLIKYFKIELLLSCFGGLTALYLGNIFILIPSLPGIFYNVKCYFDKSYRLNFKIGEEDDHQRLSFTHKIKFVGYFVMTVISIVW
jgi:hypothetical protein